MNDDNKYHFHAIQDGKKFRFHCVQTISIQHIQKCNKNISEHVDKILILQT